MMYLGALGAVAIENAEHTMPVAILAYASLVLSCPLPLRTYSINLPTRLLTEVYQGRSNLIQSTELHTDSGLTWHLTLTIGNAAYQIQLDKIK